jgi:hypothetical protein
MDFLNKLVFNHVWGSLVASHAFIAVLANVDRLIKLVLVYFSKDQIEAAIDAAAKAAKAQVEKDAQTPKP